MSDYFRRLAKDLRVSVSDAPGGLREGQIGAAFAVVSHFTLTTEVAQVVLPTGVGKTAVMTLVPFLCGSTRVLVVAPTRLVRDQVAKEFRTLGDLRHVAKALPAAAETPKVKVVSKQLRTLAAWEDLAGFDVVVGTPAVLSPAYADIAEPPDGLFDLLLVDEAHHSAARTWATLVDCFEGTRSALFTATPFRRDRKGLPGEIVYSYPLDKAITEGYYTPIHYHSVEIADPAAYDVTLAGVAASRLAAPEHQENGSKVLVRTDTIDDAERLVGVYSDAGLHLGLIHSRQALRTATSVLNQLHAGDLQGIISVGVLGEGFNLPQLKIAVYHAQHKSLAATLQFVGRLARRTPGATVPAELLAVRERIDGETSSLYADDADWGTLIPELADAAVEYERQRRHYLSGFEIESSSDISPYAIFPQKMAEVFRLTEQEDIDLNTVVDLLGDGAVILQGLDAQERLMVLVTERIARPKWMHSDGLDELEHELHIVVLDDRAGQDQRYLFVSSGSDAVSTELRKAVGAGGSRRISAGALNRVLWGMGIVAYSSVGMRNARARAAMRASYRTAAGSAVQQAVNPTEARGHVVGHLIARRQTESGYKGVGVSASRGKLWEPDSCDLMSYKTWCQGIANFLRTGNATSQRAPLISLMMPIELEFFPDVPICAIFDPTLLYGLDVHLGEGRWVPFIDCEVKVARISEAFCELSFYYDGQVTWECSLDIEGTVASADPWESRFSGGHDLIDLALLLNEEPPHIFFADGSSAYRRTLNVADDQLPPFPTAGRVIWSWEGVNIRTETRDLGDVQGIHTRTANQTAADYPGSWIICDDASNELADLVVITIHDGTAVVRVFHCKWSGEDNPGHRVDDLYEVVGQCLRSVKWLTPGLFWRELRRRLDERASTRLLHGDPTELDAQVAFGLAGKLATDFEVILVQPGLVLSDVENYPNCNTLLVCAGDWLKDQGAEFRVVGSAAPVLPLSIVTTPS